MGKLKTRNPDFASQNRGSSTGKASRDYKLRTGIMRGPLKLKPAQVHKSKKIYNRKKSKIKLKSLAKTSM